MSRTEQQGTTTDQIRNPETKKEKRETFANLNENLQRAGNDLRPSHKQLRTPTVEPDYLSLPSPFSGIPPTDTSQSGHHQVTTEDLNHTSSGRSPQDFEQQQYNADSYCARASDKNLEDFRLASSDATRQEWTVCVNLTTSMEDNGVRLGGDAEIQELQRLASQTAGKPVTILAQNVIEDPHNKGKYLVERYEIKDGKVNKLPTEPSQGMAQDVQNLLSTATGNYPSQKIALINQSHGGGVQGLSDGRGNSCTLPEFVNAVQKGLEGSGHQKLDLLDFDACDMGNSGVLSQVRTVTNQLVASAAPEIGNGGSYDAQNLSAIIKDVLNNPQLTGEELGEAIINQANRGANGNPVETPGNNHHEGTDTLAHFNLEKYDEYKRALNNFGSILAQAARDPQQKEVLNQIIASTPSYSPDESRSSNRDLKLFVEQVNTALDTGQLQDPNGSLRNAIKELLSAEQKLVESYHGNPEARVAPSDSGTTNDEQSRRAGFDKMGGLSIFLPPVDINQMARNLTPIGIVANLSSGQPNGQFQEHDWNIQLTEINRSLTTLESQLPSNLSSEQAQQLTALREAATALNKAKTQEDQTAALRNVHTLATNLFNSNLNEELSKRYRKEAERIIQMRLQNAGNPDDEGWNAFLRSVDRC